MTREGTFKNYGKLKISNGQQRVNEGTYRGDATTNLHNFSSRIFLLPWVQGFLHHGLKGSRLTPFYIRWATIKIPV